jgi:hypothetical protein
MNHEWTDKRMDDFAERVGRFEANVDKRFDEVDKRFEAVDKRFDEVATKDDLAKLESRLDRWGQLMTGGVATVVVAVMVKLFGG